MFKYETHLHTSEGSACASSTGAEMVRAHKAAGYDGVFITDHFVNANTAVPKGLPWKESMELYCRGYENALAEGEKIGLQVFFGVEWTRNAADFLLYGIDKQWLINNEELLMNRDEKELFEAVRSLGGAVVHAHPFREADYIHHIHLYPHDVDAVEVFNARNSAPFSRNINADRCAKMYAEMYGLRETAGSDTHNVGQITGCGIEVAEPINSPADYAGHIKENTLKINKGSEIVG